MQTTERPRGSFSPHGVRVPPQDVDAERALLGSLMLKPESVHEIADSISPDSFYADKHRVVFEAMLSLMERGEPVDIITVSAELKSRGNLERSGGSASLAEIVSSVPSAAHVKHYAEIIQKKYVLRRLIGASEELSQLGYAEGEAIDIVLDRAGKAVYELGNFAKRSFTAIKDTLTEAWERFDRLHKSDNTLRGVPTGFSTLDNQLSGLQNADLIILAARPSMGKTSLALDIARNAAIRHGVPVGIFSLEMGTQQLVERMLAAEGRINSWNLRTGRLREDKDFERLQDVIDVFSRAPIYIDDEPSNSIMRMRSIARRMKAEHNVGLIIVDYLQLMVPRTNSDSVVQQVTEISRSLKSLAREIDVPVLALSQLNRAVESRGGEPRLSDLRDSGSIEQDADVVLFIHREYKDDNAGRDNVTKVLIAKHRNGPTGHVELYFDPEHASFTSIEKADFGGF